MAGLNNRHASLLRVATDNERLVCLWDSCACSAAQSIHSCSLIPSDPKLEMSRNWFKQGKANTHKLIYPRREFMSPQTHTRIAPTLACRTLCKQ